MKAYYVTGIVLLAEDLAVNNNKKVLFIKGITF